MMNYNQPNNGGYYQNNGVGYAPYQNMPYQQPFMSQPVRMVNNNMYIPNALRPEEKQILKQAPAKDQFDFTLSQEDLYRLFCTHKIDENGINPLEAINDGSGNVICNDCKRIWNTDLGNKEEVVKLCTRLLDIIQNLKCLGNMPPALQREYVAYVEGFLMKFPELYEYMCNVIGNVYGNGSIGYAPEAQDVNRIREILGQPPVGYTQYYQQPMMGQPMNNPYINPQGGQPMTNGQGYVPQGAPANPNVNPMQAPYGIDPNAPNQQFNNQVNNMMPGTAYMAPQQPMMNNPYMPQGQQPGQPMMGQQPMMNNPYMPQAQQPIQVQTPNINIPGQQPIQNVNGSTVTNNNDGTVTSDTKIDL